MLRILLSKAFYAKGLILILFCRYQKAVVAFKSAAYFNSDYAKAFFRLGEAYFRLRRFQEAIEFFRKAIEIWDKYLIKRYLTLNPSLPKHYGEPTIPSTENILKILPKTYYLLGQGYIEIRDFKHAVWALQQATIYKFFYPEAHLSLGMAYLHVGDLDAAWEEWGWLKPQNKKLARILEYSLSIASPLLYKNADQ